MLRAPSVIGQHFAFAHGRTGVLQQSLLNQSDIDRLLGAHDRRETEQVFIELRFTKLIDQSIRDPQEILAACQAWVHREVTSMCPKDKQPVFDILWMDGDQPLLSYLLKKSKGLASGISREPEPAYSAYGRDALRKLVEDDVKNGLPDDFVASVRHMKKEDFADPRMIDAAVAQLIADSKLSLARKSGSKAILTYVLHDIDIRNIRTALRFPEAARASAAPHLLRGGTIAPENLVGSDASLAAAVRMAGFHETADLIGHTSGDLNRIERALNDILAGDIAVLWNVILRIEPLFAFAATALAQIRLLRAIVIGKRNDLGPQEIKQMLPPFLSASHYVL